MMICQALSPGGLMSALDQPWLHELVTALSAPTVVLSESSGQIRAAGAQGALHADIRVLSEAVLTVGGTEPTPASGGVVGARTARFTGVARHSPLFRPRTRSSRDPATLMPSRVNAATAPLKTLRVNQPGST